MDFGQLLLENFSFVFDLLDNRFNLNKCKNYEAETIFHRFMFIVDTRSDQIEDSMLFIHLILRENLLSSKAVDNVREGFFSIQYPDQ